MPADAIQGRFFLVGCPRSGTTYLQSLIAAHPQVASFPETHFFRAVGNQPRSRLGLASRRGRERDRLARFLAQINRPDLGALIPRHSPFIRPYVHAFVRLLDTLALEQGRDYWLEKTPDHIHYIAHIQHYIPAARFIHLVRHGPDTVASLYAVLRDYPDAWGEGCDLDWCIARWNGDVRLTAAYRGQPRHHVVYYERLAADPGPVLTEICRFLGLPYTEDMLARQSQAAHGLVLTQEAWKQSVLSGGGSAPGTRFAAVFTADEQTYVLSRLLDPAALFAEETA